MRSDVATVCDKVMCGSFVVSVLPFLYDGHLGAAGLKDVGVQNMVRGLTVTMLWRNFGEVYYNDGKKRKSAEDRRTEARVLGNVTLKGACMLTDGKPGQHKLRDRQKNSRRMQLANTGREVREQVFGCEGPTELAIHYLGKLLGEEGKCQHVADIRCARLKSGMLECRACLNARVPGTQ